MGSFSSKLLRQNCTDVSDVKDKSRERIHIPDPRSPTGEIVRTPITITKDSASGNSLENIPDQKQLLTKQILLKNLKMDPRSPTDGISRTPLFPDSPLIHSSTQCHNQYESPLSIYSHNFSEISYSNIVTPSEPSVNVSEFGHNDEISSKELNCSSETNVNETSDLIGTCDNVPSEKCCNITKTPLKVSSIPSTIKAKKMLHEMLSSKEFEHDFILDVKKPNNASKTKSHSVHCDNSETKVNEKRKDKLKLRTPLSNITLSSNSPNHVKALKKPYARCKIISDAGLENSESPRRQVAEWDKDKTVII